MKKKIIITLSSVVGVFIVLALLMGKVYKTGQDRPPLRYATIPESTQKFLRGLIRLGGDLAGVDIVMGGPYDWENEKDLGQTEETWSKEEDEFFIVYYKKDKDATWHGYAQNVLKAANENIIPLTKLMGKYFFPNDANGRKLPIYLATSPTEYQQTASAILSKPYTDKGSIGVTISQIGNAGCKASIVLHPICFSVKPRDPYGYVKVLMHEMNHYIFLSSIDFSKDISFYNWEIEGIADYCAKNYIQQWEKINSSNRIEFIKEKCLLTNDFPEENVSQYWAGESFFHYLEYTYGDDFVKKFLQTAYTTKTEQTFSELDINPEKEHSAWVEYLYNDSIQ